MFQMASSAILKPEKIDPDENMDFTLSIQTAEKAGLNVAWSNDAFELWILLHFEDVEPGNWRHRAYIYERLTAIFKGLPGQSPEMAAITGKANFEYKQSFKRKINCLLYVLPQLPSRREQATRRAQALEEAFTTAHLYHEQNPCTKVHHLVNSILSFA